MTDDWKKIAAGYPSPSAPTDGLSLGQAPSLGEIVVEPGEGGVAVSPARSVPAGGPASVEPSRSLGRPPVDFPTHLTGAPREIARRAPPPPGPPKGIADGNLAAAAAAAVAKILPLPGVINSRLEQLLRDAEFAIRDAMTPNAATEPTQSLVRVVRLLGRFIHEYHSLYRRLTPSEELDAATAARQVAQDVRRFLAVIPRFDGALEEERARRLGSVRRSLTEADRVLSGALESPGYFSHDEFERARLFQASTGEMLSRKKSLEARLAALDNDQDWTVVADIISTGQDEDAAREKRQAPFELKEMVRH